MSQVRGHRKCHRSWDEPHHFKERHQSGITTLKMPLELSTDQGPSASDLPRKRFTEKRFCHTYLYKTWGTTVLSMWSNSERILGLRSTGSTTSGPCFQISLIQMICKIARTVIDVLGTGYFTYHLYRTGRYGRLEITVTRCKLCGNGTITPATDFVEFCFILGIRV